MFPRNSWYVAAMSHELVDGGVLARTVCNLPLALFRKSDGTLGVVIDQCPHRLYPLSKGTVVDDGLRCGYHGLVFGTDGICREIPSQTEIPARACVRSFPVREAHGLVWIWPGDAALAQSAPLPAFDTGPGYQAGLDFTCLEPSATWGVAGPHHIAINANYMLAVDNLLDLTHTAFVHAATFDNAGVLDSERTIKALGDRQLVDFFGFKNSMSAPLRTGYMLDDAVPLFDNYLETYWYAPGIMILVHGAVAQGGDRETDGAIVLNTNIITPATETSCHYFWAQSVYRNRGEGKVRDLWDVMTRAAFAEDEETLRNQQANLEAFGSASLDDDVALVLKADKAIVLARRIVSRLTKLEA
ncbi:aromatic ring-hydroxylating dioxygenase subunit alpha [Sphingobium terrigena]|uniref:Aromatic ring-hydroxylating dioxygenase subunit alpha n=1 Tax=Sphingobium terrigena TaxID=2304063 RepID=A0A418YYG2_9SPHN|nr:aromatic ring-hydroxylating dioxygenase subunit alpha [Sphingobium terrigena]RJG57911.1 aromatic ring-hydroxylating dioxygenase subunit alpha [Sphingobium terrigena]